MGPRYLSGDVRAPGHTEMIATDSVTKNTAIMRVLLLIQEMAEDFSGDKSGIREPKTTYLTRYQVVICSAHNKLGVRFWKVGGSAESMTMIFSVETRLFSS